MFKTWNELSRKEQLECIFWDAYKDAYDFGLVVITSQR